MKVMDFDNIHNMYSHILVGAGQLVLYQCTHVHLRVVSVCMKTCECACLLSVYYTSWMYTTYSVNCMYHYI